MIEREDNSLMKHGHNLTRMAHGFVLLKADVCRRAKIQNEIFKQSDE